MPEIKRAVIYCRVSSAKQVRDGNGLSSQETRCREYAKARGYDVIEVFHDKALSGKLSDRPNIAAMLKFLRQKRNEGLIVVIDDISRLARHVEIHFQLRFAMKEAGAKLESPSLEFGEDADSKLIEGMLACVAAHGREKNAEQTLNRMRARLMNGYWVFQKPPGYDYKKVPGQGKILVRQEPLASIISEALEDFASGVLSSQAELKERLERCPQFPKDKNGEIHFQRIKDLLTRVLYAGYIEKPDWGVQLTKGHHEPLISFDTYRKIQSRLKGDAPAPAKSGLAEDFPLRGFVRCGACGSSLTACWSKGRSKSYPYYWCANKDCSENRKSIRKETIEQQFEDLLTKLTPSRPLLIVAAKMFVDLWQQKSSVADLGKKDNKVRIRDIDRQCEKLMERILGTESEALASAYEDKLSELQKEKAFLEESLSSTEHSAGRFEEIFRTALEFLADPLKLWRSGKLNYQRIVLKLAFAGHLNYNRKTGFQTPEKPLPFKLLSMVEGDKKDMAHIDAATSNHLFETLEEWEAVLRPVFEASNGSLIDSDDDLKPAA